MLQSFDVFHLNHLKILNKIKTKKKKRNQLNFKKMCIF